VKLRIESNDGALTLDQLVAQLELAANSLSRVSVLVNGERRPVVALQISGSDGVVIEVG
jgi:hypothetical protein